jgi:hypothetical protein
LNPQDPLANLHPLREPDLIGWWPLAPGWWMLAALLLLSLGVSLYFLLKYHRANAYRRGALAQLQGLNSAYLSDRDPLAYLSNTNALLKSVALQAFPRQRVASCSGNVWSDFLNDTVVARSPECRFEDSFADTAYEREVSNLNQKQVHNAAKHWIKRHRTGR